MPINNSSVEDTIFVRSCRTDCASPFISNPHHTLRTHHPTNPSTHLRLEKSRSQRILWLLEELKIDYELKVYKRGSDMLAPAELKSIHPLGKSPVIGIQASADAEPIILAESGAIVEYLSDHFGQWLIPKRYQEGKEGQVGGETEEWSRWRFYMHYAEGSLMTLNVVALVISSKSHPSSEATPVMRRVC